MSKELPPKVSVIVPIYKTPLIYFKECLNSLCEQNMREAEFILVFDGENKELLSICESYKEKDDRFKIFIQPQSGVSATRNFGIGQASGEYLAFVDADDILVDGILKKAFSFAIENSSDIVIWDCISFSPPEKFFRQISDKNIGIIPDRIRESIIQNTITTIDSNFLSVAGPWAKLYKKELFYSNKFDLALPLRQDRALNLALYQKKISLSYLHEEGYLYRIHNNSAIRKYRENLLQECCKYLKCVKETTNNKYPQQLGLEAMQDMWLVWEANILNPQNKSPFLFRVRNFIKAITSKDFRSYLSSIFNFKKLPLPARIEIKLLQHKITLTLWLRAFIWKTRSKPNNS